MRLSEAKTYQKRMIFAQFGDLEAIFVITLFDREDVSMGYKLLTYIPMKNMCNQIPSQLSFKDMNTFAILTFCCLFSAQLHAQTSPALDPNYVTLQPKESFKGYWGGTAVGAVIENVGLMTPTSKFGDVFINSLDTLGYGSTISEKKPLGLFLGGSGFSLFNRAKLSFNNASVVKMIYSRGRDSLPLLIENSAGFQIHYPKAAYDYDTGNILLASPRIGYRMAPVSGGWSINSGLFNADSLEDIVIVAPETDSTISIIIWDGHDLEYKGDTDHIGNAVDHILPQRNIFHVPGTIVETSPDRFSKIFIVDFNHDGIPDIAFLSDSVHLEVHHDPKYLSVIFGKRDDTGEWEIDTSIQYHTPYPISGLLTMDFLWSDGIADLILRSSDTIYCYSGGNKNFLRTEPDWLHPDLAIPNPEMVDMINFKGNGLGAYTWVSMSDAGNINGSREHSLSVLGSYTPDLNNDYGISYCMLYSGGKAADEKADAIFADNTAPTGYFQVFDTVQSSLTEPMNMLIGDPYYDQGGIGRVYFVKGSSEIPYHPDPRWSKVVANNNSQMNVFIELANNPVKNIASVIIRNNEWSNGQLTVRDLLGRSVFTQMIFANGEESNRVNLNLDALSSGVYIIEFSCNFFTVSTRCILFH